MYFKVVNTSTQTVISSVPETVCTCPVSSQYITLCPIPNHAPRVIENPLELQPIQSSYENEQLQLLGELVGKGSFFVKIAGLSGVSAVAMGAYGAHSKYIVSRFKMQLVKKICLNNLKCY